jgi:hypothetical protein
VEAPTVARQRAGFVVCALFLCVLSAVPAEAQRHRGGGLRGPVIVHSPLLYRYYDPFYFGFAQWYPGPYPVFGLPPFPAAFPADHIISLRLQITPRDALVFVDGYPAGVVDDYDGVFQRLRLIPGSHELTIYLRGYRTFRQAMYFNPGSGHTIKQTLIPLAPGEPEEPEPTPRPLPAAPPPAGGAIQPAPAQRGTLALRVQPADAAVYIDGELWRTPQGLDRLVFQLSEGSHRVRVDKPGLQPFTTEVDVRAGETTNLNVSLTQ